jgi:hypothetical protein
MLDYADITAHFSYACLCVTLREEHYMRVFENRALGRIFGSKRAEVRGVWGKLHNDKLYIVPSL